MENTTHTTDYGYTVASAAGSDTRHIVAVTGDYYGAYAPAAVCGTSPRERYSSTRWFTTEDTTYPTPAAAVAARPVMMCKRCIAAAARMTAPEVSAPAESLEENTMTNPILEAHKDAANRRLKSQFAMTFPALEGGVVMQGHADYCRDNGHATHTVDGVVTEHCPRCGDRIDPAPATHTPVRADAVQANTPVTGYYGPNPVIYVRAVTPAPAPAPGYVVVTWVTANGTTFEETLTNAHIIYTATAPIVDHPGTWTEDANHTWEIQCPAADDGEFHYTLKATGECWTCKHNTPAARAAESRAAELAAMVTPGATRVDLDTATAPTASYRTARATVTAYFQGGAGRGECIDAVIVAVTGGDSHPARMFAASDAVTVLQGRVSGNITAGEYQTIAHGDRGTLFIYGTWTN